MVVFRFYLFLIIFPMSFQKKCFTFFTCYMSLSSQIRPSAVSSLFFSSVMINILNSKDILGVLFHSSLLLLWLVDQLIILQESPRILRQTYPSIILYYLHSPGSIFLFVHLGPFVFLSVDFPQVSEFLFILNKGKNLFLQQFCGDSPK